MHCPSCGQQQVSNETKFCSRCGFPLGLVSEVLAHGGFLPQLAELNKKKAPLLTRRNGLAFSLLWFLFFLFIMTPLLGMSHLGNPGVTAILGIFGGLMLMISSFIFLKKERVPYDFNNPIFQPGQGEFQGQPNYSALPPQQTMPVDFYAPPQAGRWRETNDLQATSVTETTTQLLNKEERR